MIKAINAKTFDSVREGIRNGADFAIERTRRLELRKPWVYRKPLRSSLGGRPWLLGLAAVSALAAVVAGVLYARKRRQVADRYSMGPVVDPESLNGHPIRDEEFVPSVP